MHAYTLCRISRNLDAGGGEIVYIYVTIASHKASFVFIITETSESSIGPGTAFATHHVLSHSVAVKLGLGFQWGTGGGMSLDPLAGGAMPAPGCLLSLDAHVLRPPCCLRCTIQHWGRHMTLKFLKVMHCLRRG